MALATRVSFGSSAFNSTTTPKTVSITVNVGDRVVVMSIGESGSGGAVNTACTGNSETFTQVATLATDSTKARIIAWTMTTTASGTYNISAVRPMTDSSAWWGVLVWVYRDSDGFGVVGAPTAGSTSNSVTATTTAANSTLVIASGDWNAADGASRTRRTVNSSTGTEELYGRDSSRYTWYAQRYDDAGSAGSKTGGYSAPGSQVSSIVLVEIKGTSGVSTVTKSYSTTWNVNGTITKALSNTWSVRGTITKAHSSTWNVNQGITKAYSTTWNINALVTKAYSNTWGIGGLITKSLSNTWNVNIYVVKDYDTSWIVREGVVKWDVFTWDQFASVTKNYDTSWNLGGTVTKSYSTSWNINGSITKALSTTWNIQGILNKTLSNTWNVSALVTKNYSTTWDIASSNPIVTKSYSTTWYVDGSPVMGTYSDIMMAELTAQGYTTGSLSDRRRARYIALLGLSEPVTLTLTDLEFTYLRSLGHTGSTADMRRQAGLVNFP